MITRDADAFLALARAAAPDFGPATARAAFLVAPDGFRLAEQSARDNAYMADAAAFDAAFRRKLFEAVRNRELDGLQTSSLMNDLGYASRIIQSLRNALLLGEGQELTRQLRQHESDQPAIILP